MSTESTQQNRSRVQLETAYPASTSMGIPDFPGLRCYCQQNKQTWNCARSRWASLVLIKQSRLACVLGSFKSLPSRPLNFQGTVTSPSYWSFCLAESLRTVSRTPHLHLVHVTSDYKGKRMIRRHRGRVPRKKLHVECEGVRSSIGVRSSKLGSARC